MKTRRQRMTTTKDLRTRAEERLHKTRGEIAQMPAEDVQRLVHELQVHQIELEMQNEELRRFQVEVQTVRDQFVELYDFAPIGYLTLAASGEILEANLTAAKLLGLDRESLIARKLTSFLTPESQDTFYLHQKLVAASRTRQACEVQFRRKDGTTFFGEVASIAARGGQRKGAQSLMAFSDQSARKQAETALLEASQLNQQIIASAQEGIIVYGRDLKYQVWNPYMEKLAGVPAEEVLGKQPAEVFPFLRDSVMMEQLHRALAGQTGPAVDFPFHIPQSGRTGWASDTNAPLRDRNGEIIGVIGTVRDITERKKEELALRRSENNFSNFFNLAPMGLQWVSASGIILRANQAQLALLGYTQAEYVGRHIGEFYTDPSPTGTLLVQLAAKETVINFRARIRRKDGALRDVLIDANSMWEEKHFVHSFVFTRDIARRVELEREILAVSEREQRRIAQDLHDGLGQILTGTLYLASNLRQQLAAEARPEAKPLSRIVRLLDEAISQTRGLARGLHPVKAEPNGLMVALKELSSRTRTIFHLRCRFKCPQPVLIENHTVATHLYRIAQEAITNAIKHGKPGRIEIGLTETPSRLALVVQDNGRGLPARKKNHQGMGLRIMQHRAGTIDASLVVQKRPRGGTAVVCSVHKPGREAPGRPTGAAEKKA